MFGTVAVICRMRYVACYGDGDCGESEAAVGKMDLSIDKLEFACLFMKC